MVEQEWRKAIADQVRRNCTLSPDVNPQNIDAIIYFVADWIESPPEWSHFTAPINDNADDGEECFTALCGYADEHPHGLLCTMDCPCGEGSVDL